MPKRVTAPVNKEVLIWARVAIGYDVPTAAKKIGVKPEKLKEWEGGGSRPSFPQLKKIASTYKRVTSIFFYKNVPQDPSLPKDFRVLNESQTKKLAPTTIVEIRNAQRKRFEAIELAELLGETPKTLNIKANLNHNIPKLAERIRKLLGISIEEQKGFKSEYDSFKKWRESIENLGVLVFQASLKSIHEMRGLAIYKKKFPIILLNTKDEIKPRLFSLLHEFCHILLGESGIGNMEPNASSRAKFNKIEVFCNAFAGECLVPSDSFSIEPEANKIKTSKNLTSKGVKKLANRYFVSWDVIVRRLRDLNFISEGKFQNFLTEKKDLFMNPSKKKKAKGGPPYEVRVFSYNGDTYNRLVLSNFFSGNITSHKLSSYMGLKLNLIEKMVPELGSQSGSKKVS